MHFLCFILLSVVHSSFELSYKKRVANLEEQSQQLKDQLSIIIQNFASLNTSLTSILDNKRDSQDELLAIKQNDLLEEQNKLLQDEVAVLQQKALETQQLKDQLSIIEQKYASLDAILSMLNNKRNSLEEQNQQLKDELSDFQQKYDLLNSSLTRRYTPRKFISKMFKR